MDHLLWKMSENSGHGLSFGNVWISDLDYADDAVIFAVTNVSANMTADATTESIPVSGVNVGDTHTFTYLGSVIHSSTSWELEVNRRLGRAWSAMIRWTGGAADTCAKGRRSEFLAR